MATKEGAKQPRGSEVNNFPDHRTAIEEDLWDVIIVGAGPGGLMASATFARLDVATGTRVLTVDSRDGPTIAGRADGVQPRTLEVFRNMPPIGEEMIARGSRSYERTFWAPPANGGDGIVCTRRVQSCPTWLDTEEPYTLGVQQGLIEKAFLRDMDRHNLRVTRPYRFESFTYDPEAKSHPVTVTLVNDTDGGSRRVVRTEYLIGTDGGRSAVRQCMSKNHGITFDGDWVDTLWGAIDAVVETSFPDIRKIAAIASREYGSVMIFPREHNDQGNPVVRLYTQIDKALGIKSAKDVRVEDIMEADRKIFAPYALKFTEIEWWTAYPIGQRLASHYDVAQRIFIAGDACHTHSPKAGQGMNTSMIDAQNLAWKLHLVLCGLARPEILATYHQERHSIGKQLIDFDAEYSALFSGQTPKNAAGAGRTMTPAERDAYFVSVQRKNANFTTGLGVYYPANMLNVVLPSNSSATPMTTTAGLHDGPIQKCTLHPGRRLETGTVTRFLNSEPCKIIHEVKYDAPGGFRIYVLTGPHALRGSNEDAAAAASPLRAWSAHLRTPSSFLHRFRGLAPHDTSGLPPVSPGGKIVNPYFALLTVVPASRFSFELADLAALAPLNTHVYADDHQPGGERISDDDGETSVGGLHRKWGLQEDGGIVICRPDGYVGCVAPLNLAGSRAIEAYFDGFLVSSPAPRL